MKNQPNVLHKEIPYEKNDKIMKLQRNEMKSTRVHL